MTDPVHPAAQLRTGGGRKWIAAALGGLALALVGLIFLSLEARREIDALAVANGDNTQWSLAQLEVELIRLELELVRADQDPDADLSGVRTAFNIFYSRVTTIREARSFEPVRALELVDEALGQIQLWLDGSVDVIDGSDAELRAALPEFLERGGELRDWTRHISIAGVRVFAADTQGRREAVSNTLLRLAILTSLLLLCLFAGLFGLTALLRAVNRQKAVEDVTNARLEAIISTSLDAVVVVDINGRIIDFNGAAEDIFGCRREDVIGRGLENTIIPEQYRKSHREGMERYRATGKRKVVGSGRIQLEAVRKNGEIFPVEFSISSVNGLEGEIFVSYIRDISKQVADESELVRARDAALAGEKAKAELLAVMSHEMRTPLNGVLGTLDLIRQTELTPKQRNMLDIMGRSGQLLLDQVNDVLDISRHDAGRLDVDLMPLDARRMAHHLSEIMGASAARNGNSLSIEDFGEDVIPVIADERRLRQVLVNLVGNATKFTRSGDIIVELELMTDEDLCEIRVIDTGVGIREEDLERIFEDFVTADASFDRNADGTGLGLGISKRFVEAMHGEIGVESEPGEGSVFWVRLPAATVDQLPAHQSGVERSGPASTHRGPRKAVLVVEDNQVNRFVVGEMLAKLGHDVTEAHNGQEGVELASRFAFDLILMDISMPVMDGIEACRRIRGGTGKSASAPIIALTAHAMPDDLARFKQVGMNDVLTKPLTTANLDRVLSNEDGDAQAAEARAPLVDPEIFGQARSALGPDAFDRLLTKFITETDEALAVATGRIGTADDLTGHAEHVHKIAGSAAVFGAARFHGNLRDQEQHARLGQAGDVRQTWPETLAAWAETKSALKRPQAGAR